MGRRRDDDDDDDGEDDLPIRRPQNKGSKTIWIVLGIVALVLLLVVGVCVGGVYWAFKSAKSKVDSVGAQFESSFEAESFLGKLSTGQTQTAYESGSPAFKSSMSRDQLEQLIKRNPLLTKHRKRTALTFNAVTGSSPSRKQVIVYELSDSSDDDPWAQQNQTKGTKIVGGPKIITVTITVAEQAGGFWKVENLSVQ